MGTYAKIIDSFVISVFHHGGLNENYREIMRNIVHIMLVIFYLRFGDDFPSFYMGMSYHLDFTVLDHIVSYQLMLSLIIYVYSLEV